MSNVPKSQRKESKFEARHHLFQLRDDVTTLVLNDFGFSAKKYQAKIDKWNEWHKNDPNCDKAVEALRKKCESFSEWFIDEEAHAILGLMRRIEEEFNIGNAIYPSETPAKIVEFFTRRWHMNRAIGLCYALKHELNYVIRTLPVDINKYERFSEAIDKQIALLKGVRQSDNRLIKPKKGKEESPLQRSVTEILENVTALIYNIGCGSANN